MAASFLQRPTLATATDIDGGQLQAPPSPLHEAARRGVAAAVRRLLDTGTFVDLVDTHAYTPLHVAAWAGQTEVAGMLLDRGADPNARAALQMTPLHFAAMLGAAKPMPGTMAGLRHFTWQPTTRP